MCIQDVRNEIATARRLAWQLASFLETNGHEKQTDIALETLAALIRANDAARDIQYAPISALIEIIATEKVDA